MMPEGTAHRRADRCFATLRSDQRAKDQERNYRNDVALTQVTRHRNRGKTLEAGAVLGLATAERADITEAEPHHAK
jgi:hypothetical protein